LRLGASLRRLRHVTPLLLAVALVAAAGSHAPAASSPAARASAARSGPDHASQGQSPPKTATSSAAEGRPLDPALFAPGSCEEFLPTAGDSHRVVFLDAGHGGVDPGSVGMTESGETIYESDLTLPVELDTMSLLRAAGYTVVVSRTTDSTVLKLGPGDMADGDLTLLGATDEVEARDQCANLAHAEALIGIYFDWGDGPNYAGCVTGYDTARPFAAANATLAQLVQTDVLGAMNAQGWGIPDQGAVTDDELGSLVPTDSDSTLAVDAENYGHLLELGPAEAGYQPNPSQMPGVVVEPLYLTDPFEGSIAASETGQQVIAGALAEAVEQFLPPVHPWLQGV
jgi:N-acetylmuramoyl-L-alanine amidase